MYQLMKETQSGMVQEMECYTLQAVQTEAMFRHVQGECDEDIPSKSLRMTELSNRPERWKL